jgi:hypothetical protein
MSEHGYEEYGYDTPESYEVDADAIAQQAAETVHQAYAPIIQQQQQELQRLSALTQFTALKGLQEMQSAEEKTAQQARNLARETVGPQAWDAHEQNLAAYLEQNPELLPESKLGDAEATAGALLNARRMYQEDLAREARRRNDERADANVAEMKQSLNESSWQHMNEAARDRALGR